jgi:hypothetical protein
MANLPLMSAFLMALAVIAHGQQLSTRVRGHVTYPDGRPAPGVRVFRYRPDNPTGLKGGTISQSDGSFELDDLEVGVAYDICASKPEDGYLNPLLLPFGLSVGGQCERVTVQPRKNLDGLRVRLSKKTAELEGQVIDSRTRRAVAATKLTLYRPLVFRSGLWVLVPSKDATWVPSAESKSDTEGRFHFSGLPEGEFFLKAQTPGYPTWFFRNKSSESTAERVSTYSGKTTRVIVLFESRRF